MQRADVSSGQAARRLHRFDGPRTAWPAATVKLQIGHGGGRAFPLAHARVYLGWARVTAGRPVCAAECKNSIEFRVVVAGMALGHRVAEDGLDVELALAVSPLAGGPRHWAEPRGATG